MQSERSQDMRSEIRKKERRYERECEQIAVLDRTIAEVRKRYKRAKRDKMRSFQYNIGLRLQVLNGVRCMYSTYARIMADQAAKLRDDLIDVIRQIIAESNSDNPSE
ncbi:hypothetical protein ACJMK2_043796 [Sinanodonta woodiana]|uniref:Uncharacterized protein n=1 Tax=Sinanodonta woodiana TaxID=1069815 RepID=A0ABD3W192_SINWO